ncbi:hypothetical protein [Sphingomonas sp.]|uniref:hypothetical protein n=1 Tax=Sphingomonas sp. TaxID=28214 RepID=UPI0034570A42
MFPANNDGSRNGDINKITFMEYDSNSDGYITRDEFIFLQKMQLDCDKFVSKKTNSRDRLFDLCKMELSLKRNN